MDQPGEPESLLEYTKLWAELIDRGGLYHINDEVSGQFYIAYMFLSLYVCTNDMFVILCKRLQFAGVPLD